jgi:hypothetical protein
MISEINGFKIIEDFGVAYKDKNISRSKTHFVIAICKQCENPWKTSYYTLNKINGCGCNSWKQLKPLPEYINGFRIIKCHGYDQVRNVRWATVECKECKKEYEVDPNKLQYRNHCGCIVHGSIATKYEKSHPRLSRIFRGMVGRCYNKNNADYYNYGGRDILICDEWKNDRNKFCEWALKNGYKDNLTIDRIDSNKGYYPENCRWEDAEVQARNTRRVKMTLEGAVDVRSKHLLSPSYSTILSLAKEYDVSDATIYLIIQNKIWKES